MHTHRWEMEAPISPYSHQLWKLLANWVGEKYPHCPNWHYIQLLVLELLVRPYRQFFFLFFFFFFLETTQTVFSPSYCSKGREERSSMATGSCKSNTRSRLHTQGRTLSLLLMASGALHVQRNFSNNEL